MTFLADLLSTLDARKRVLASNLADLYQNPRAAVSGLLSGMGEDVKGVGRRVEGLLGDVGSVIPEVKEQGQEGLLGMAMDFGPGALGTFAGVGAKTANKAALAKAQTMAKAGADPVDVWKATGWTDQFPDGKWRFEIPDYTATLKNSMLADVERGAQFRNKNPVTEADIRAMRKIQTTWPAQDAMSHPTLWKAYSDDVAHYPVSIDNAMGSKGAFSDTEKSIGLAASSEKDMQSTLLHELQHAVQQREGFARGGSPAMGVGTQMPEGWRTQEQQAALLAKQIKQWQGKYTKALDERIRESPPEIVKKAQSLAKSKTVEELQKIAGDADFEYYRRLAGEAEARLTQSRMNLTPTERAARPPWLEFDVPREQQIVRGLLGE